MKSHLSGEALADDFYSRAPQFRTKEKLAELVELLINEAYENGADAGHYRATKGEKQ